MSWTRALVWDIHRRVRREALPEKPLVVRIELPVMRGAARRHYLLLRRSEVSLCTTNPGYPEELVLRTVEGSAVFARRSGRHLAELRNMVTSPGGTSAAAIYELEKGTMRTVLSRAVYAAFVRTRELGAEAQAKLQRTKK